jgi:hypothetical protein
MFTLMDESWRLNLGSQTRQWRLDLRTHSVIFAASDALSTETRRRDDYSDNHPPGRLAKMGIGTFYGRMKVMVTLLIEV